MYLKVIKLLSVISFFGALTSQAEIVAGIEVGSKGVKAYAFDVAENDINRPKKIFSQTKTTDLILGAKDGYLDSDRINASAQATKFLFEELKKLDPAFIVIAGSTAFDKIKNKTVLQDAIKGAVGISMKFISSDEEMNYGLRAAVPQRELAKSILVDIGGGNTKLGYITPMSPNGFESITLPYGSNTLSELAAGKGGDYVSAIKNVIQEEVRPLIKKESAGLYGLTNPQRTIYLQGGASWAVANFAKPQDFSKDLVVLSLEGDIGRVVQKFEHGDFEVSSNLVISEFANKELFKIMETFSPKQLQAGSNILYGVLSELGSPQRKVIFPRTDGWIVGYMFAEYNSRKL